nr:oligosaccharide flippase family protein [uncultured Chryseobacterium sp.]
MLESKKLFKNIASLGVIQVVNYIFPLLTVPYVSRILGPHGLGLINYVTAFVTYFTLVVTYAFDMSATRSVSKNADNPGEINNIFCKATNARLILFLLSSCFFLVFIFTIKKFSDNLMLSLIIYLNVVSVLISTQYLYQGLQKISFFGWLSFIKGILLTISVFILIQNQNDYIIYAFITSFLNLLINLFLLFYAHILFGLKFRFLSPKISLKVIRSDRHLFLSSVVFNLYTSTNIVILGMFQSSKIIGYYTVALGLINIIQSVVNIPMSTALFPFIGNSFSKSLHHGLDQLRRIFPLVFYITFAGGLLLFIFAPFLVTLIYGKAFMNSIISVRILCFLPLLSCLSSLLGTLTMINLNMDKEFLKVTFLAALISLLLNFSLGYYLGYIGTSISYLSTEIFVIMALFYELKRKNINLIKIEYFSIQQIRRIFEQLN